LGLSSEVAMAVHVALLAALMSGWIPDRSMRARVGLCFLALLMYTGALVYGLAFAFPRDRRGQSGAVSRQPHRVAAVAEPCPARG
jgi:hypothetical protein